MAQQAENIKLYRKTQLLFKRFDDQVQSDYITVLESGGTNFSDTLYISHY